jgi:hypothetical protein
LQLNSSVQFLTSAGGSPNLERRSVNEGRLTGAKFTLAADDDDDDLGDVHNGNGDPTRQRPVKGRRRPRSLSEDRRNSDHFEHLVLLSPSDVCLRRAADDACEPLKLETAIV